MAEEQEQPSPASSSSKAASGSIAEIFKEALAGVQLAAEETASDIALMVARDDLSKVMSAARHDQRLALDYLRCLSGVDQISELEVVYHLYSFQHQHSVAIKVRCPNDDPHVPSVSHLWQTANWHEREAAELFGIVFDGHPDPRPLLTEEGLGYYILRKSHPLAEIEEWQEDYLGELQEARQRLLTATGAPSAPVDEKAQKIANAQKKAVVMKKARDEARARGLAGDEEKAAVRAAIDAFEAEQAAAPVSPVAATARPVDDRAAKIALAQKKAQIMKKARDEARARGLSPEDERAAVRAALDALAAKQPPAGGNGAAAPPPPPPVTPADDRAAKIALAQKKAQAIKKAREDARSRGLSPEDERKAVQEALRQLTGEGAG